MVTEMIVDTDKTVVGEQQEELKPTSDADAEADTDQQKIIAERPPNPQGTALRHCVNIGHLPSAYLPSLVRHGSLMKRGESVEAVKKRENVATNFIPVLRSGGWADIGDRDCMEDTHICIDSFVDKFGFPPIEEGPGAFYGVFDGHGGKHAAQFACDRLPSLIVKDADFPLQIEKAARRAFLQTDNAFAEACSHDAGLSSGTTALVAVIIGRYLLVANAGDCRAVLSRRGKAIEMSRDHRPDCTKERIRIEASGGYIDDGYLNGQLNVTRALGDWHMEGLKAHGVSGCGPLSAEPELKRITLTEEDEFLIIGCDGLWEVFLSQNAVDFARRKLQEHNDPLVCCKELIDEALKRKTADNLTAVVVCLQSDPPPNLVVPRSRVRRSISAEGLRGLQSYLDSLRS